MDIVMIILNAIWQFLQSPSGVMLIAGSIAAGVAWLATRKPEWMRIVLKYGPLLEAAVRKAEKAIPDDTTNAGAAKLDAALKYAIQLIEATGAKVPGDTAALKAAVERAVTVVKPGKPA